MNLFSVNQVNHVYVANALKTGSNEVAVKGDIKVKGTADGKSLFFKYFGAGGQIATDIIDIDKIMSITATPADKMAKTLNKWTVTLSNDALDGSSVVPGQDFILKLEVMGYVGISPEDSKYWKYGVVKSTNGMTVSNFYVAMALSVAKNMSREAVQFIKVYLGSGTNNGTETEVTARTKAKDLTGAYTGIIIKEVAPEWIRGTKQEKIMRLVVTPGEINVLNANGTYSEVTWGTATKSAGEKLKNGKQAADYEYFFMGERGDQYRMVGFPDYVPTEYLVDPAKEYDFIGIHYFYCGANEAIQKSEKDLTIIVPRAASDTTASQVGALASSIVSAIEAIVSPE